VDAHPAQLAEPLLDAALHDVLELDDTQDAWAVTHQQRCTAAACHFLHSRQDGFREYLPQTLDVFLDGVRGAFANLTLAHVDSAHAGMGGERHERSCKRAKITLAQTETLLSQ